MFTNSYNITKMDNLALQYRKLCLHCYTERVIWI